MKIFWNVLGILLILVGALWFLQGVNILGGNALMSGHSQWAVIGGLAVIVGAGLLVYTNRSARTGPRQ